ncbi:hypothetical protein KBD59_04225 [Candidatus Gracilibacteria bacterium]|nr:hypothetical protein [Candidatus Gracilibacteria bacterium]
MKFTERLGYAVKGAIVLGLVSGVARQFVGTTEDREDPEAPITMQDIIEDLKREEVQDLTSFMRARIARELGSEVPMEMIIFSQDGPTLTTGVRNLGPLLTTTCDVSREADHAPELEFSVLPSLQGNAAKAALLNSCAEKGFFPDENITTTFEVAPNIDDCGGDYGMAINLPNIKGDICEAVICQRNIVVEDIADVSWGNPHYAGRCASVGVPDAYVSQSI